MSLDQAALDLLSKAFRPHAPIDDPASFVGRRAELERVRDSLFQPGLQIVIFGERGAGKTSLANIATSSLIKLQIFCQENSNFQTILKDIAFQLQQRYPQQLVFDATTGIIRANGISFNVNQIDTNELRLLIPADSQICIILDELDRLSDEGVIPKLAEMAKNFSTYKTNVKLILIGVADNLTGLLRGHESNFRNIRDVPLGPMTSSNVSEIVSHGASVLGIQFLDSVTSQISELSDRFPYYVHLVATEAARACLLSGNVIVTDSHLLDGVKRAAEDAQTELRKTYDAAISSVKGSHIYKFALWSLASLPDQLYRPSDITSKVNGYAVAAGQNEVTVQAVGQALKVLSSDKKNQIIRSPRTGFYGLNHPLMKGYIRLVMKI